MAAVSSKTFTVRYYIARVGADGAKGSVASLLDGIDASPQKMGAVRAAGNMVHQIRIHSVASDKREYRASFVRFRDELPLVSARDSTDEAPPELKPGQEVIEKNHFTLFVEENGVELIAYQMSMEGSDVAALPRYFTHIHPDGETISFDEVIVGDAFELLKQGVLKYIEFEVAKPRSKAYAPDPEDDWSQDAFEYMAKTGATRFKAKIYTTSAKKGLVAEVKDKILRLLHSSQTKTLKARVSGVDHPIDLFADRIFDKISVNMERGWPNSHDMFNRIQFAKRENLGLTPYLAKGDDALE